jgi:hypothetical protein
MKFLVPQGIGDSIWALTKVQSIAESFGDKTIDIVINVGSSDVRECRAMDFILGFDFVNTFGMKRVDIIQPPREILTDVDGHFRYIPDGPDSVKGIDWTLMPNAAMERGIRLEDWLPEYKTNWNVMEHFKITQLASRRGLEIENSLGQYCVFYMGPLVGNTKAGHNRGPIWKPEDWIALGKFIQEELRLGIVVVGAEYDKSYFQEYIHAYRDSDSWLDLIGRTGIDETYSIISKSRFVVSYQSGIGIVAEYLRIPTAIFWRQKGDSISDEFYGSFDEKMNGAWSPPDMIASGKHMALYYGRHDVKYICDEIVRRGW